MKTQMYLIQVEENFVTRFAGCGAFLTSTKAWAKKYTKANAESKLSKRKITQYTLVPVK